VEAIKPGKQSREEGASTAVNPGVSYKCVSDEYAGSKKISGMRDKQDFISELPAHIALEAWPVNR